MNPDVNSRFAFSKRYSSSSSSSSNNNQSSLGPNLPHPLPQQSLYAENICRVTVDFGTYQAELKRPISADPEPCEECEDDNERSNVGKGTALILYTRLLSTAIA